MPPGYALIGAVVVLGLGIMAWVFVPAFQGQEAARKDLGTHRLAFGMVVSVLMLNFAFTLPLADQVGEDRPFSITTFGLAALATQIPILLVLYLRLIWPRALTWSELGLRPLPLDRVLRVGLTMGILTLALTIVVELILSQLGLRPNQFEQFTFIRRGGTLGFAVVLFLAAVSAPFSEELFFRGYLFGMYRQRQPLVIAYIVSNGLFAAAHLVPMRMNLAQMAGLAIGIFLLGTLLSWTYQRTGSLYPSMVAHAVNNSTALLLLYSVPTLP